MLRRSEDGWGVGWYASVVTGAWKSLRVSGTQAGGREATEYSAGIQIFAWLRDCLYSDSALSFRCLHVIIKLVLEIFDSSSIDVDPPPKFEIQEDPQAVIVIRLARSMMFQQFPHVGWTEIPRPDQAGVLK